MSVGVLGSVLSAPRRFVQSWRRPLQPVDVPLTTEQMKGIIAGILIPRVFSPLESRFGTTAATFANVSFRHLSEGIRHQSLTQAEQEAMLAAMVPDENHLAYRMNLPNWEILDAGFRAYMARLATHLETFQSRSNRFRTALGQPTLQPLLRDLNLAGRLVTAEQFINTAIDYIYEPVEQFRRDMSVLPRCLSVPQKLPPGFFKSDTAN